MPIIKRILIWCRNILIFLFISSILAVVVYKFIPVYYTPLMLTRLYDQHKAGKPFKLDHTWVPLSEIAQPLVQAVVASEDNLFLDHNGFDIEQIQKPATKPRKGNVSVVPARSRSRQPRTSSFSPRKVISGKGSKPISPC